jgi:hypothetical protein
MGVFDDDNGSGFGSAAGGGSDEVGFDLAADEGDGYDDPGNGGGDGGNGDGDTDGGDDDGGGDGDDGGGDQDEGGDQDSGDGNGGQNGQDGDGDAGDPGDGSGGAAGDGGDGDGGDGDAADGGNADGDGGDGDGEGDGGEDDGAPGEPLQADDLEVFGSAADFPDATAEDFADDSGDWTDGDYAQAADRLFGGGEYYGEDPEQRYIEAGWEPLDEQAHGQFADQVVEQVPAAATSVSLFSSDGGLRATGFVAIEALAILRELRPDIDFSLLNVAAPRHPADRWTGRNLPPLPAEIARVVPPAAVDLRKYCSPVGDQGQTLRCAAFAWTHGEELLRNLLGLPAAPLACNYTMLEFQRMQGDARDFQYAFAGGEGTVGGPDPGQVLAERGTCPRQLWPDDEPKPAASEKEMARAARDFPLPARVLPIALDSLRQVLASGYPVQVTIDTGEGFARLGRSGVFDAAEAPSGQHGRHAMLAVGYIGNYFILKNSWGADWGDQGYAYLPKKVLADAGADLIALIPTQPAAPSPAAPKGR